MLKHNKHVAKNFDILVTNFNILHNYFDELNKIILYLAKFFSILAKPFFPCDDKKFIYEVMFDFIPVFFFNSICDLAFL